MIGSSTKTISFVAVLLTGLAVLAGCGGSSDLLVRTEFVPYTPEQKADLAAQATHAYRIQERDKLQVRFAYERVLDQDNLTVLNDGTVSLVGIGNIKLAGLTLSQADSVLTAAYSREYREPALAVLVQETSGRRVYVLGEVKSPGLYTVPVGGIDMLSAVAVAGGFTENAARSGTLLIRSTLEGYQFQEVNLDRFDDASFAQAVVVPLQAYDVIWVPRSRIGDFGYFARNVLSGMAYITRMIYDVNYISTDGFGRY
jgi:protein involved in polysaccharide export with SLBB domain